MSAFDKIRQAFPELANASDSEVLGEAARRTGSSVAQLSDTLGIAPRSTLGEIGRQFGAGLTVDAPRMAGQALKYFSDAGGERVDEGAFPRLGRPTGLERQYGVQISEAAPGYRAGQALVESADVRGRGTEADLRGRGLLGEALVTGARGVGGIVPTLGLMAVPGGQVLAPALQAGLFGGSSAQDTYEKLVEQGIAPADAEAAARRVFAVQGLGEGVATAGLGALFRPAIAAARGARSTSGVAQSLTDTSVLRPFARGMALNVPLQAGTEAAQDVGTSLIEQSYGARPEDIGDIARGSALAGAGMTLLLGPLALGGSISRARNAERLQQALYDPQAAPEVREAARQQVMEAARQQGVAPANAEEWLQRQLREDAANIATVQQQEEQTLDALTETPYADIAYALRDPELSAAISETDRVKLFSTLETLQAADTPAEQRDALLADANETIGRYVAALQEPGAETDLTQPFGLQRQSVLTTPQPVQELNLAGGLTQVQTNIPDSLAGYQAPAPAGREMARTQAPTPVEGVEGIEAVRPGVFQVAQPLQQVGTFVGPRAPAAPVTPVGAPTAVAAALPAAQPAAGVSSTATTGAPSGTQASQTKQAKTQRTKTPVTPAAEVVEDTAPKNVSEAIKEDNEIDRVLKAVEAEEDTGGDKLFAGVTGQAKKAPGRPSMPTQVYAAIRNAILNPKGAVMVRKAKSVEKDVALTEKYGDKVKRIAAAAKAFADAYETYSSQNLVRSGETIKRDTTADAVVSNRAEVLLANARAVQSTLAKLGEAVEGNAKDVEAIVRFVKDRAQKEKRSDQKVVQNDILLSRAWAAAKRETFIGEPDLLDVSPAEVRQSREATAKGATPQLVEAATDGYKTMGQGEAQTGLNGILNYIRTVGTPFEKTLAQAIKLAVKGKAPIKLEFVKEGTSKYDPKTNTITINETSSKEVALHEALHGALQWFVYTNPNAVQVVALKTALQRVVNFDTAKLTPKAAEVQAVLKKTLAGKSKTAELDAVLELISYGNTLNDFRRALQGMESNAPRTFVKFANDIMDAIYALVRRMLGSSQTVASDVMENTFQLLESARQATQEAAPKKGNVLQAAVDTTTSAFKRWFGDSKVAEKGGKAKVVYTGTSKDKDFAAFKVPRNGVWFTEDAASASSYAVENDSIGFKWEGGRPVEVNTASRVIPVFLRVENPYTMTPADIAQINKENYKKAQGDFFDTLRAQGYDGVDMGNGIWVVLKEPAQIKSAIGNKGTFDPASGNILKAEVTSYGKTPVVPGTALPRTEADAITGQFQNPVSEAQLKKLSKTLLPEQVSSKFLFDTLGWASVPGKLEGASKKISDYVQKNHPGAATVASWVNSHFGLQAGVKDALVRAKDDRRGGSLIYNQIAQYFTDLPPQQSVAVLEYMDAKLAQLRKQGAAPVFPNNDAQMKDLADATITKWWEYARALRDPKQRDAYAGLEQPGGRWTGGVKFSQGLAFAESVDQLASPSFGVRNISKLISTRTKDEVNADAISFRTDANGDALLTDKFVGMFLLTPSLKKRLDNASTTAEASQILAELKPDEFISADLLTQDGKPRQNAAGVQLIPDRNYLWDLVEKDKGGFRFTARLDAKQALMTKKGRDLGHALQNTMAILANSYSANRLTEALASYEAGTPNATAFNSLDDLNAMLNGEYKGDKYELNKDEASWTTRIKQNQIVKLTDNEAKSETVKGLYRNRNQWVQLPPSPTYGALAGKIVNGSVWSAIEDMSDRRPLVNSAVYNGTMRWFKKAKTVYNPATWGTNVASNFTMAMMDDIPLPTLGYATKLYVGYMLPPAMAAKLGISLTREQQQLMLEIMKTNALLGDFSSSELKQSIYDSMRSTISDKEQGVAERIMQFAKMEKDRIEAIKKYAGKGADAAERTDQLLGDWYAMQDNVFRVASMLNNLGQQAQAGKTIDAEAYRLAGDHARFAFLDYDIDSKAVRIMRQTAFPFISWPYAAAKMIGNVAVHKPWKLVNLYAGLWILDGLTQAITGDDDDELRESGPEWARSRMLFGLGPHTHIRVPFMGDSENPVYYDIGKYITPSSFGDRVPNAFLGLSWWPSFVSPGGPYISAALALVGGIDPYNGRPLSPPSDSDWEKLSDRLVYTQSLFAPNLPFLNARELEKAKEAFAATEGRSENYSSLYMARTAGMRFYDFNVQGSLDQQDRAASAVEREYKTEIGKLKRKQERLENPDWEAFYEREEELMMRMEKRIAEIRGGKTGEE
jgi:hypothetical protein